MDEGGEKKHTSDLNSADSKITDKNGNPSDISVHGLSDENTGAKVNGTIPNNVTIELVDNTTTNNTKDESSDERLFSKNTDDEHSDTSHQSDGANDFKCTSDINDNTCRIEMPSKQSGDNLKNDSEKYPVFDNEASPQNNCTKDENDTTEHDLSASSMSLDKDDEEILKNTKFSDSDKSSRRVSRPRRSGVVNDYGYVARILSTSSNNSDDESTNLATVEIELNEREHISKEDVSKDDGSEDNDEAQSPKHANFYIGHTLSNSTSVESEPENHQHVDNQVEETALSSSTPTDDLSNIYYEEGPKRLKKREDFSGAKTYQNKNSLIVKYPNRKVSFEHRLIDNEDQKISSMALEASPRTILKNPQRRASYETQMYRHIQPTGHINYAYLHDEMRDKLEKRKISMETAHYYEQESEMYNGNEYNTEDEVESPKAGVETGQFERIPKSPQNGVNNGFCKKSHSEGNFEDRMYKKRPSLIIDGEEYDVVNKNFSAHLRKDSIALTSEKLHQLENIQRHYNPKTYVDESVWKKKLSNWKKYQLHLCVITIFMALVGVVVIGWHFHNRTNKIERIGKRIFFDPKTREMYLSNPDDTHRLTGMIGLNVPNWQLPFHCHSEEEKARFTCLRWKDKAVLRITYFEKPDVKCYNISWESLSHDLVPFDCFDTGNSFWYGPGNQSSPTWPLSPEPFTFSASKSRHFDAGTFSSAVDYHWISSTGSAIFVPNDIALEIDWNVQKNKICLVAKYSGDFYGGHSLEDAMLNYTVCNGIDAVTTFKYTRTLMEKVPKTLPTTDVFQKPVWSFKVDSKSDKNDENAIQLLNTIEKENLDCSVFEIGGQWQNRFGDLTFSNNSFSNLSHIEDFASKVNCGLSVEVNPYFDVLSANFKEGSKKEYFIKDSGSFAPGIVKWNHEINAMIDVSKTSATSWIKQKLSKLKTENGIQSFSIVYAEPYWIPYNPSFYDESITPSALREMFSEMFSAATSTLYSDIIQGTSNTQDIPYFLPVRSTVVSKNGKKCLRGAIERTLALAIKGYPFVMSDLLPNNNEENSNSLSRELYIRWLQLSAFLPAMRFTIMPWKFDKNVVEIAQNITQLHKSYIVPTMLSLKHEILDGLPIIRPIWWVYPNDQTAFNVSDQFLIGDNILIAPVLCENEHQRQIYFPEGMWSDKSNGNLIQGKSWINYDVTEHDIPHFVRVKVLSTDNPR